MIRTEKPVLAVAGDVTVDWLLAVPAVAGSADLQAAYQWETRGAAGLSAQPGGAALLATLAAAAIGGAARVEGPVLPPGVLLDPTDGRLARTYSLWQPHPSSVGGREVAWRMHRFLGFRPGTEAAPPASAGAGVVSCVVLDDAGLGFRDEPASWPWVIGNQRATAQIVLKMAAPIGTGALWEHLVAGHADRLTLYVAAGDLRKGDAAIGQPLSWERLAGEVAAAVRTDPRLARPARVVVSLGLAGAVLVERDGAATLIFDPLHQEGDWERLHPGTPTGLGTCVAATLALAAVGNPTELDWAGAVLRGLTACRAVHEHGYVPAEGPGDPLGFPVTVAAEALAGRQDVDAPFWVAPISDATSWQLLPLAGPEDYRALARRIVVEGDAEACRGIPVERMGAWTSIDRTEIESVRSLRHIVRQYLSQEHRIRPLSLAVFGPPGSGKSFAVKQMAKEWSAGGVRVEVMEFNVAQFASTADLAAALQRVRDATVQQALPLVFWDEFDSPYDGRELGWLARFLAPMQDGTFLEGGVARPIGPALFVFAGGTYPTLASFKERAVMVPGAKATDFLSRLRGHVDVLGPNPSDAADRGHVLRRALLLRAQLLTRAARLAGDKRLGIDPGVLRAFLEVPAYLHGARSLEAIVEMSALAGRLRYERSSLPARHQLALHVDAEAFLGLIRREDSA